MQCENGCLSLFHPVQNVYQPSNLARSIDRIGKNHEPKKHMVASHDRSIEKGRNLGVEGNVAHLTRWVLPFQSLS